MILKERKEKAEESKQKKNEDKKNTTKPMSWIWSNKKRINLERDTGQPVGNFGVSDSFLKITRS